MFSAASRTSKADHGQPRPFIDENATPANASAFISASMLQSGGLSPLPSSDQLYDLQLPDISALSPLELHSQRPSAPRRVLVPVSAANRRASTPIASQLKAKPPSDVPSSSQPRGDVEISVVIPYKPDRSSRSRSRSTSAQPRVSIAPKDAPAFEAEGGLMTPPASGMSQLSPSQLDQADNLRPHPTSPTPLHPRSRTHSPQKRTTLAANSHTLTPGTLASTPVKGKRATAKPQQKRTRDLIETPVIARVRGQSAAPGSASPYKASPNPRSRKNTRTTPQPQDGGPSGIDSSSDSGMESDVPLADVTRLDTSRIAALSARSGQFASSSRASKAAGKRKGRKWPDAAYKDSGATEDEEDSDIEVVKARRNGPEASFLREAKAKGWDRIENSPVRTFYVQQDELSSRRQRSGSARARTMTPKLEPHETDLVPAGRAPSRSASRSPAINHDDSAENLSNQSIKSSSSQVSTATTAKTKKPGLGAVKGRRRASSSASTTVLRIKTGDRKSLRRVSAPPANHGEIISDLPAMPDSPSEDPLLLVGPEPDYSARFNTSRSFSRNLGSPSVTKSGGRGCAKAVLGSDATFAIPEEEEDEDEDEDEDEGHYDRFDAYQPLSYGSASQASPSKAPRERTAHISEVMTSTPLPGARKAAQLPSEIPLPISAPETPVTGAQDLEIDILDAAAAPETQAAERPASPSEQAEALDKEEDSASSNTSQTKRQADSSAEVSHGLRSMLQVDEAEPVTFGQDQNGFLTSDESESECEPEAEPKPAPGSEELSEGGAQRAGTRDGASLVQGAKSVQTDGPVARSGNARREAIQHTEQGEASGRQHDAADQHDAVPNSPSSSIGEPKDRESNADSDSDMEFVGQAYNRDQDTRIQPSDDGESGSDQDHTDQEGGRDDRHRDSSATPSSETNDPADSSRIDDEDDEDEQARAARDSADIQEVEILAGSSTRDRTPELPIDGNGSPVSSDGFEILDIVTAQPSEAARGKQRAISQGQDGDVSLPVHTIQLMHQDDLRRVDASRSLASRSFGAANQSMSVDASSASAYTRFMRLSQQTTTPIIEISSLDPHAAARATAILKLYHQYVDEGWIHGEESGDASRINARGGVRGERGTNLPDDMDPHERAKVQQVVRILQEAERIAASQKGGDRAQRSIASVTQLDPGSLTLPQILMDAEINIARQDAQTEASSDDGFSVRSLLAPSEARAQLLTPQTSARQAGGTIASPVTPFLPGGFRPEPASIARPAADASVAAVEASVDTAVWSRDDWVRLDKFFAAHVRSLAKTILRAELTRSGAEEISQTQILDVDKAALQIQALLSVDIGELAIGFLDHCRVAEADRRAEWASSKIRFRIPALQRKYLRKLEARHPGHVTAEHVSMLERAARGDTSVSTSFTALGHGRGNETTNANDSIATEDLDWSLTAMTTRNHILRGGVGDADRSASSIGLRLQEGRRAGRVSFGTPYRLGTHSTPLPALKRVQEQAKQDGLYPSLPVASKKAEAATEKLHTPTAAAPSRRQEESGSQARNEAPTQTPVPAKAQHKAPAPVETPAKPAETDPAASTPSMVTRTTRLLSRMSGSFFGLGASPGSSSMAEASKAPDALPLTEARRSRGSTSSSLAASSSRIPALKKSKLRQPTPVRDFGGNGDGHESRPTLDAAEAEAKRKMEMVLPRSALAAPLRPISIAAPKENREAGAASTAQAVPTAPPAPKAVASKPSERKLSISVADLQAASRSIREKRNSSSFAPSHLGDSSASIDFERNHRHCYREANTSRINDRNADISNSSSGNSGRRVGRLRDTHPFAALATAAAASTIAAASASAAGTSGGRGSVTVQRTNSGFSGLTRPTALALLPDSEATHELAREKVKQLAKSRQERGWKSPRAARTARLLLRPEAAERRVQSAAIAEMRRSAASAAAKGADKGKGTSTNTVSRS
ncbi:hypothetical protein ACQY0O_008225 [Thecaphora frezii]